MSQRASNETKKNRAERSASVYRVTKSGREILDDTLAVEEPLEIRVVFGPEDRRRSKGLSITMRTPGNDDELAAGFLLSENIVNRPDQIESFKHVGPLPDRDDIGYTLEVMLKPGVEVDFEKLQRHFYTTSSCGVCGKASLDSVRALGVDPIENNDWRVDAPVIFGLPLALRQKQSVFNRTGGIHAAGLASADGNVIAIREDVGRHNAVDKLIGSRMLSAGFPLEENVLVVSGRASFELMQKALMASIPMLVAVGAPSSLAVDLANSFNMTLIGFTSDQRFNIYSGADRVTGIKT